MEINRFLSDKILNKILESPTKDKNMKYVQTLEQFTETVNEKKLEIGTAFLIEFTVTEKSAEYKDAVAVVKGNDEEEASDNFIKWVKKNKLPYQLKSVTSKEATRPFDLELDKEQYKVFSKETIVVTSLD